MAENFTNKIKDRNIHIQGIQWTQNKVNLEKNSSCKESSVRLLAEEGTSEVLKEESS